MTDEIITNKIGTLSLSKKPFLIVLGRKKEVPPVYKSALSAGERSLRLDKNKSFFFNI